MHFKRILDPQILFKIISSKAILSLSLSLIASMQSKTNSYMIYFLEISYENFFPIKIQKKNYDGSMIKEEMINDTN